MKPHRRAPGPNQAAIWSACEDDDVALDLAGAAHVDRANLHPERGRHRLDGGKLASTASYGGVTKHCRPRQARRDLLEQFQPFAADVEFETP